MDELNKNTSSENSISLLDILQTYAKNKIKIFLSTGIICVLAIIMYFFVMDLIYTSTATIKSTSKGTGLLGGLDAGIPDIGELDDLGLGSSKSSKELASYQEILFSRRCLEKVITHFGLFERDKYEFMEEAVKYFREEQLIVDMDRVAGTLTVSVLDKDRQLAKDMADFLLQELNNINIEINVINAKNNRQFIEKRYLLAKEDLRASEDSLKAFQLIYGIAPDLQIKASAQAVVTLEAELKAEEVKLDVLLSILGATQPEVKMQQAKIASLKEKIGLMQTSTDVNDFLKLGNSPQIGLSFLRLQREIEIQTRIVTFLLPLYEQAKIEENRDTPTILVLDHPYVAEKKTKPKRFTMVVVFTVVGFFASIVFFLFLARFRKLKAELKSKMNTN